MPERPRPRVQTYCLRSLEQARILADPLRIRVLQAFSREPKTTKQVAGLLGEKPTRLYHHVQALETVGLIELVETRPVRGTVEKYFQAVASRFEVDSSLFFPTAEDASEMGDMIASILDRTRAGLLSCADRLGEAADEGPTPLLAHMTGCAGEGRLRELQAKLLAWLKEFGACEESAGTGEGEGGDASGGGAVEFAVTVAFYPIDRSETGDDG